MAVNKDIVKKLMDWGLENENNRREAIQAASFIIATLNCKVAGKKLTDAELDNLYSGLMAQDAALTAALKATKPATFGP